MDPVRDGRGTPPDEMPPIVPRRPSFLQIVVREYLVFRHAIHVAALSSSDA